MIASIEDDFLLASSISRKISNSFVHFITTPDSPSFPTLAQILQAKYVVLFEERNKAQIMDKIIDIFTVWPKSERKTSYPEAFILTADVSPGDSQQFQKQLQDCGISSLVLPLSILKEKSPQRKKEEPIAFILGVERTCERQIRLFRWYLSSLGIPILVLPRHEAEVLQAAYHELSESNWEEERVYDFCCSYGADFMMVRRALGMHPAIGQHSIQRDSVDITAWLGQIIAGGKLIRTEDNHKPCIGIWGTLGSTVTQYLLEYLHSSGFRPQLFSPSPVNQKSREPVCMIFRDKWSALEKAEALFILEENEEFSRIYVHEWEANKEKMNNPLIIDAYGLYEPEEVKTIGYKYISYGRNY
jgi:UDP-glucose 6-dehydrogenase